MFHEWDSAWPVRFDTIAGLIVVYLFFRFIYNVYLHPLSKVPGPVTWSASRIPFIISLLRGNIVHDIQELHRRYGPILRIAPDEVTFTKPDAWNDIFQPGPGSNYQYLKDPTWWAKQPGKADSMLSAIGPEHRARIRKTLTPAFTPRALKAQEPILQQYVGLLVDRLRDLTRQENTDEDNKRKAAVVDISPWFHYTTFDIFGDLGFGESFDCLQHARFHPWISLLFNSVKAASYVAAARFYPWIDFILMSCIPASLKKMADDHYQQIVDKVDRRFNWEVERADIMSHVIKAKDDESSKGMSTDETYSTFGFLTTAGSETTATALSGTLNYLVTYPDTLSTLCREIRGRFTTPSEITLDALRELPYLNAVIDEGLRLCPPVPWILPRCVPSQGGSVCGVWLPGGTRVSIQAYAMNRDPAYFHSPDTFIPKRWLHETTTDPESPFFNDKREVRQPFSMGARNCMGQHLALAEMRLILANLVYRFDFEALESERLRWEDLKTFLLVEKKPVKVRMSCSGWGEVQ